MSHLAGIDNAVFNALSAADQIDIVCDRYEDEWCCDQIPNVNNFLEYCDPALQESLLEELLLVDRELRSTAGLPVSRADYLARYPEHSTVVNSLNFSTIADQPLQQRTLISYLAGDRFAHFELIELLGQGSSGIVWKAFDIKLRRHVALKLPRLEHMSEPESIRFRREGQTCAQLQHPNIVAVYEVGVENDQLFIASELIDGGTLRDWLNQNRRLHRNDVATLTIQLAEALQHAHDRSIVHRDLKPANVLIDPAGKPYITDFGLAKWNNQSVDMTVQGHLLGTPAYMSPEQARGDALGADPRSDIYGLGAILYELLTRQPPFTGNMTSVIHHVTHCQPVNARRIDATIPSDLETICLTAMQKRPADRYQSMQSFADDLKRFLVGEPILARPLGVLKRGWRLMNRRKALVGMMMASLVAAGSLGMAAMLAEKNHALLGFRKVTIATDPPGARVAFVPLNSETGVPDLERRVMASGFTPLSVDLMPGDYLVVAVMKDGRFHEVYRHVPEKDEILLADSRYSRFKLLEDDRVELQSISIPSTDLTEKMTLVEGSEHYPFGVGSPRDLPAYIVNIPPLFIDNHEFTWGDYKRLPQIQFDPNLLAQSPGDAYAMPVGWGVALEIAEELGKRLPTEAEYEYVATNRGTTKYPWGNNRGIADAKETSDKRPGDSFGPVGFPNFDRLIEYPDVAGLCTNKAEWVMPQSLPILAGHNTDGFSSLNATRIYRGGSQATTTGDLSNSPIECDPRQRGSVLSLAVQPGISFRCVRSVMPRVSFEEFD